jgi:hypothetical protein
MRLFIPRNPNIIVQRRLLYEVRAKFVPSSRMTVQDAGAMLLALGGDEDRATEMRSSVTLVKLTLSVISC